jgi:hypothetical protein
VCICETETAVVVARAAIAENGAWEILLIFLFSKTVQILEREGQSKLSYIYAERYKPVLLLSCAFSSLCKIFLGMLSIGACLNFMRMGVI